MKLSARNQLKGKVVKVQEGAATAIVTVDIGNGNLMKSSITIDALHDLGIKEGSEVFTVIKSSSVILGVED